MRRGSEPDSTLSRREGGPSADTEGGERFQRLFEALPEGAAILNSDGITLSANASLLDGGGLLLDQLRRKQFTHIFPESEREALLKAFGAALRGEKARVRARYVHPVHGREHLLSISFGPFDALAGERVLAVVYDRTRIRLLESQAVVTQTRHDAMVEASPDAVFSFLFDGRLCAWNRMAHVLLGWSREEVLGAKLGEEITIFGGEYVKGWLEGEELERLRAGETVGERDLAFRDRSGKPRWGRVRVVPHFDDEGRIIGGCVNLRDITLQRKLEERLAESAHRYRTFVEQSDDVIFQILPDMTVLYVNPAVSAVFGYEPSDWMQRRIELPVLFPPEEVQKLRREGPRSILRRGFRKRLFRMLRRDGTPMWARISLSPVGEWGRMRSLHGIARDVTEHYEARKKLEAQQGQLKTTVRRLREGERLRDAFVSNITHELRTPLTTILITSEILEKRAVGQVDSVQERQVYLIRKNAGILLDLINDLLDLAKLKDGAFPVKDQVIEMASFLALLEETMGPQFSTKGLAFETRIGAGVPVRFRSDRDLLRKILVNILSNACKFTDEGRVALEINLEGDSLCFTVADTGVGIPEDQMEDIFDEFRRVEGIGTERKPGTGLGLAISRRFIDLLNGRIDARSRPGEGSSFSIRIPYRSA